jgi:hypothetical protein
VVTNRVLVADFRRDLHASAAWAGQVIALLANVNDT